MVYIFSYIYMKKNIYLYTYIQIIINGKVEEMRQNHRLFMIGNLMLGDLKYISRFFLTVFRDFRMFIKEKNNIFHFTSFIYFLVYFP